MGHSAAVTGASQGAVVSAAHSAGDWSDFAVALARAVAALTGPLSVAVSINPERILQFPALPSRAGLTLILFVTPLLVAIFLLVPGQGGAALAAELLATGVVVGAVYLVIDARLPVGIMR
ncbi:MAG TPA: hypothetical protein VGI64_22250 [Streptosporangiaceae bacterium]